MSGPDRLPPNRLPPIRRAGVPLDGRKVHLRPADASDAAAFAAILVDPTVHPWWQAADPAADARELADRDDEVVVWAIELEGVVVGVIQAHERRIRGIATPGSTSSSRGRRRIAASGPMRSGRSPDG